jgi:hypothetical protein
MADATMIVWRWGPLRNGAVLHGHIWMALLFALALVISACDEFSGIEAIGVQRIPVGSGIEIIKAMCPGDRVTRVSLILAPGGVPNDSETGILWKITSEAGSTRNTYVVGTTPPGFVEEIPLSRSLTATQGLAATIDTNFDAAALITFTLSELRSDQVLDPDGYFSRQQLEDRHRDRCET